MEKDGKKSRLWAGLTGIFAFVLILMLSLTALADTYKMLINDVLGLSRGDLALSGTAYADENGDMTDEGFEKLIKDSYDFCAQEEEEGSVLLMNKNDALPLKATERKVSLFGANGKNIYFRSSAGGAITNPQYEISLDKAFKNAGFSVNETLFNAYPSVDKRRPENLTTVGESPISFYTSAITNTFEKFNDVAIVTISRCGTEDRDVSLTDADTGARLLALSPNEADMLKLIKSNNFGKTIVLVNSVYPMELGWIAEEQYGVDACLWIGNPGYYGLTGVVNVLTGVNPSGRTQETFAANSYSAPSMRNFGLNTLAWGSYSQTDEFCRGFVSYNEGIYVGYKYYETRYEDAALGRANATAANGAYASAGEWNYADEVVFPFGYGMSYTTFGQKLDSVVYNAKDDTFTATVTVSNTGSIDGKTPIELYVQAPYTAGGVEKSAIQLVAYDKVFVEHGKSATKSFKFDRYLMASYDTSERGGYILDAGKYYFAIGNGAHEALNNILAQKKADGISVGALTDHEGNTVSGDTACVAAYTLEQTDKTSYKLSRYNDNAEVKNRFADADINYWASGTERVTYLTRSDWTTYPTAATRLTVTEQIQLEMTNYKYSKSANAPSVSDVPNGVKLEERINFLDMKGVEWDDPKWDTFISQLRISDLAISVSDSRGIAAVARINKPMNAVAEGPEGLLATFKYGDKRNCTGFATLPVVAATWDHEMQSKYGDMFAEEALWAGVPMVNAPGCNIIRTPYGGRASEYMSEDGILSYYCASNVVKAMRRKGLIANIKHCALNEQEAGRQGVATFSNEQAIREIYLKPFEGVLTRGEGLGIMTSYNRIGLKYAAVHKTLMQDVMRGEWGYTGMIIDDALPQSKYSSTPDMMLAGTDMFCLDGARGGQIEELINRTDDGTLLKKLQESNKRIFYVLLKSSMGGIDVEDVVITTVFWWQIVIIVIDCVAAVLCAGSVAMFVIRTYVKKKQPKETV